MLSMQSSFGHLWIIELQSKPQHSLNQQFSTVLLATEVPDGSSSALERDKIAVGGCLGKKNQKNNSWRLWDIWLAIFEVHQKGAEQQPDTNLGICDSQLK